MFAPIYAAAVNRGIAPSVLDLSPIHVVGWALGGTHDENSTETAEDLFDAYRERQRLAGTGKLDEFYVAQDGGLN